MANVFDTAKYILNNPRDVYNEITEVMLLFAGMSLVWDDAPLFQEDFQAWQMVQCVRSCFTRHKVSTRNRKR